jgi:hypothetical protein
MDPQPQISDVPMAYTVCQLRPPPPPVVLPALLTDILFEPFPPPVALSPLKPTRARTPTRARIPTRTRNPPRARTPATLEVFSSSSPLTTPETSPEPSNAKQNLKPIKRPSNANISDVKSIFARLYPDLEVDKQDAEYARFRVRSLGLSLNPLLLTLHQNRLDQLTSLHLDSSLAFSHQDEESLTIINEEVRPLSVVFSIQR